MTRDVQGLLIAVIGAVAVRLALTGAYLSYLKAGMRLPLLAAGIALIVLGGLTLLRAPRSSGPGDDDEEHLAYGDVGHDHGSGGPRVAWLLLLPLLAILLVAPAPLGAYAAGRESSRAPTPVTSAFPPLPDAAGGPIPLSLTEFVQRAYYDDANSLASVRVRLSGFVVADPEVADGYQLTRFALSCCAADAFAIQVEARGADSIPPNDTWVEVEGTWLEPPPGIDGAQRGAAVEVTRQTVIEQPENPYE